MTSSSSPPDPIKVGLVGLGRAGWCQHAPALAALPDLYQLQAVYDTDSTRSRQARQRFNCRVYDSYAQLLSDTDIELVVIAVPTHLHTQMVLQAFQTHKHVLCEKPMTVHPAQADAMIAAAEKSQRLLTVFHILRYDPAFRKIQQLIDHDVLGRIIQIRLTRQTFTRRWDWQMLKSHDGGLLNNTGSHLLDQALVLLGDNEPDIFCHFDRVLSSGDTEDHAKIILRSPHAPLIDIELTNASAFPQQPYLVLGDKGTLSGSPRQLTWRTVDFSALADRPIHAGTPENREYNHEELNWTCHTWSPPSPQKSLEVLFYEDLFRSIRHHAPLVITPLQMRRLADILEKCHQIAADQQPYM